MLIRHLPATSETVVAQHGAASRWSASEHLAAATADAVRSMVWQLGGGKGTRPERIPRPGDDEATRFGSPVPLDELRRRLERDTGIRMAN